LLFGEGFARRGFRPFSRGSHVREESFKVAVAIGFGWIVANSNAGLTYTLILPSAWPGTRHSIAHRKRKVEAGATARRTLGPYPASVPTNNVPNDHQTDPSSLKARVTVQSAESAEKALGGYRIEPDPVVPDVKHNFVGIGFRSDLNPGLRTVARIFERIVKQVQNDLPEHRRVAFDLGHRSDLPNHLAPGSKRLQVMAAKLNERLNGDPAAFQGVAFGLNKREIIIDERLHLPGSSQNVSRHFPANRVAGNHRKRRQHAGNPYDLGERVAQVLGDRGSRFRQLAMDGPQFGQPL